MGGGYPGGLSAGVQTTPYYRMHISGLMGHGGMYVIVALVFAEKTLPQLLHRVPKLGGKRRKEGEFEKEQGKES